MIAASGANHYFVSRWTAYAPTGILQNLFGIDAARLLVRWVWATLIVLAIFKLSPIRRIDAKILASGVVITMPIFVRALFTDYTESTFVPALVLSALLAAWGNVAVRTSLLIGLLAAIAIVANVFAIVHYFPIGLLYAARVWLNSKSILKHITFACIAFGGVIGFGWLYFRLFYGLENVYEPTIRFAFHLRNIRDPLLAPTTDWILYYSWIYLPILSVAVAVITYSNKLQRSAIREQLFILAAAILGIIIQWSDQFLRGGGSLELSYYWSYGYWITVLPFLLILGSRLFPAYNQTYFIYMLFILWLSLLWLSGTVAVPGGMPLLMMLLATLFVIAVIVQRYYLVALCIFIIAVAALQVFPPKYVTAHKYSTNPFYNKLFHLSKSSHASNSFYEDVKWFTSAMQKTPNPALSAICTDGPWGGTIIATYAPQITGRLLKCTFDDLVNQTIAELSRGQFPQIAVLGKRSYVLDVLIHISELIEGSDIISLDENSPGFQYSLGVLSLPSVETLPMRIYARDLPSLVGDTNGSSRYVQEGAHAKGYLNYGPYLRLDPGMYRVTFSYRSNLELSELVGWVDVFANESPEVRDVKKIYGTRGEIHNVEILLAVKNKKIRNEFRTYWNGHGFMELQSVTINRYNVKSG